MELFILDKLLLAKLLSLGSIAGVPVGGVAIIAILGVGFSKYLEGKNNVKSKVRK